MTTLTTPERLARAKAAVPDRSLHIWLRRQDGCAREEGLAWLKEADVPIQRWPRHKAKTVGTNGNTDGVFRGSPLKQFERDAIALQPLTVRCRCGWSASGLQSELVGAFDAHECKLRQAA